MADNLGLGTNYMKIRAQSGALVQRILLLSSGTILLFLLGITLSAYASEEGSVAPRLQLAQIEQPVQSLSLSNVNMIRALNELTALKEEVKVLRNRLEEMYFNQRNDSRRQEDFFRDVDRRLTDLEQRQEGFVGRLESLETTPVATQSGQVPAGNEMDNGDGTDVAVHSGDTGLKTPPQGTVQDDATVQTNQNGQTGPINTVTVGSTVAAQTFNPPTSGTSSVSLNEQDAYDSAFDALKLSRYEEAIEQFQKLIATWPESELADDSLYWMSEANYVNREFEGALNGFRSLIDRFPSSSRAPEAMLKIGYIQYDIGAYDQAAKTFEEILARFPGHQITVPAEIRLRRIKQTIN